MHVDLETGDLFHGRLQDSCNAGHVGDAGGQLLFDGWGCVSCGEQNVGSDGYINQAKMKTLKLLTLVNLCLVLSRIMAKANDTSFTCLTRSFRVYDPSSHDLLVQVSCPSR